jgi:hypothetical protein
VGTLQIAEELGDEGEVVGHGLLGHTLTTI